jgi:hypothetical protein
MRRAVLQSTETIRNRERLGSSESFFQAFFLELNREEASDSEPERFSSTWRVWQRRHWERERLRTELREAEALTLDERDPAPLSSQGLAAFLDWSARQSARRGRRKSR